MKEQARGILLKTYVWSGLSKIGRAVRNHDGCLIFYGHRVSDDDEGYMQGLPPTWFDEQLAYLTRHYDVIPLSQLVECLSQGKTPPRKSVVLTFDDGFRDNYENAFPILQKYGVSATIFVVTGSLTSGELPWSQRLGYLFQETDCADLECEETNGELLPLRTQQERKSAYRFVKQPMTAMRRQDRDCAIARIADVLQIEAPVDRMMTWEHAREMQAAGIEIGAHTYSHPLLANISLDEAKWEMEESLRDLKREVGVDSPAFCFPAGSYNEQLLELVKSTGFCSSFIPNQAVRINAPRTVTPFSMTRRGLPEAPAVYLEAEVEGPFNAIRGAFGRYER